MYGLFLEIRPLRVLFSILTLSLVACSGDNAATSTEEAANSAPTSPSPPAAASPSPSPSPQPSPTAASPSSPQPEFYNQAINSASSAITISQSAVSRDDWNLVASRWQDAINLLKTVPASSPNHTQAQAKLAEYQRHLAEAKQRATPPPQPAKKEDGSPEFFSVPIKAQIGGLAVVEVKVNDKQTYDMIFDTGASKTLITASMAYTLGLKPVGKARVMVADGAIVEVAIAQLQSMEMDGRLKRNFQVAVAPPSMPIGLLGQDFFRGYDVTITNKAIEFRKRSF